MSAKVVVACGVGVATSEMVAAKLRKLLAGAGVDVEVMAVPASDLDEALKGAKAFVPVVAVEKAYDVPTFDGSAFLTGEELEDTLEKLVAALKA